jgi:hypothetical protein
MKITLLTASLIAASLLPVPAQESKPQKEAATKVEWKALFDDKLSNATFPEGVWSVTDGVLTATKDEAIWTTADYENFELQLEFKTDDGTNSGVIVYGTDIKNWIPNSVEIQIADDHSAQWSKSPKTWQCGAVFGRLAATKSVVKKPGEWNSMLISCKGQSITVTINGEKVTEMDMAKWTDAKKNPDGSEIPAWLNRPLATMATKGKIGFQGKHAGKPIYFKNIQVRPAAAK